MALRGIPEAVLEASHPLLAGWLGRLGLYLPADAEFATSASDLDGLVRFAQVQADQRNRSFAASPAYVFHFERRVRARQETHQAAELRLQRH